MFGLIGFAHKKNVKRTLENNFTKDEDYKINVLPRETIRTGPDSEIIMLNTNTFKELFIIFIFLIIKLFFQKFNYYKMIKNISNFQNTSDYLPILNGVLITDLIVIFLLNIGFINSKQLKIWYDKYNLSAVIADVLIIILGIIISRAIYPLIFDNYNIFYFILLTVFIQVVHDILFYYAFWSIPRGKNKMLDTFKDYANEVSYMAIISDSMMMISSILLSTIFANVNLNTNLIVLLFSTYLVPYFIYK